MSVRTRRVKKDLYENYLKKARENLDAARECLDAGRLNAATINAIHQFTSEVCQFQDQHSKRCRGFLIEPYSSKLQSSRSSQILFSIFLDCLGGRLRKSLSTCLHIRLDPIPFLQSSQLCLRTLLPRSTSM